MMMMMIAPTLLFVRRRGFRGGKAGDQRKGGRKRTQTSDADVATCLARSGVLDATDWRKYRPRCGIPSYRKGKEG